MLVREVFFGKAEHVKEALAALKTSEEEVLGVGDVVVVGSDLVYWESLQVSTDYTRFECTCSSLVSSVVWRSPLLLPSMLSAVVRSRQCAIWGTQREIINLRRGSLRR